MGSLIYRPAGRPFDANSPLLPALGLLVDSSSPAEKLDEAFERAPTRRAEIMEVIVARRDATALVAELEFERHELPDCCERYAHVLV